jgi:hypothetical protein
MYIVMESSDSTTTAGTPTTPAGWSKLGEWTSGAGATGVTTLTIFGKIAGAGEADVTVSGVGNHCAGAMIVIADHGLANITATVVGEPADHGTSTTNVLAPAINVAADSLILTLMGLSDDANDTTNISGVTNANLASITERIDQTVATGAGGGVGIYTGTCAGTNTGTTEWDHDTAERSQSVQLGIPPTGVSPRLIQRAGGTADNTTSVVVAYPANVVTGDLLVIAVVKYSPSDDAFVVGDISKSAGTATLGSFTLDQNVNFNFQASSDRMAAAIYSAPVTAGGSCTITVGGAVAGSFLMMSVSEWEGLDTGSSRLEDSDTGTGASGAPATATATSAGAALFIGVVITNFAVVTTHTPGADYTTLFESEDGANHTTGSAEARIVTAGATDAADWVAPTTSDYACVLAVYRPVGAGYTLACDTGSYAVTGQTAAPLAQRKLAADAGAYVVTGATTTLAKGFRLTVDAGSYAVAGQDTTVLAARRVDAVTGSYALTGQAATLAKGHRFAVDTGSYALTGAEVAFLRGYAMPADAGVYSLTGAVASLLAARRVDAASGAYALTGQAATLAKGFRFAADAGSYILTGAEAAFLRGYGMAADAGVYAVTGGAAAVLAARRLTADTGSYSISGQPAALLVGRKLLADAGVYGITGSEVAVLADRILAALAGVYTITGQAANLVGPSGYTIQAGTGVYAVTGAQAGLLATRLLTAQPGAYALTGQDTQVLVGRFIQAVSGIYGITGQAASMLSARLLAVAAGSYTITGADATLTAADAWLFGEVVALQDLHAQAASLDDRRATVPGVLALEAQAADLTTTEAE